MIRFTFGKGGKVKVEPTGYPGQTCQSVSQAYTNRMALGGVESTQPTEEAEQDAAQTTTQHQEHQ